MLKLLSYIFAFIVRKRRKYYILHPEKQVRCNIPVISVGNISVGGSGKTPFCRFLADKLVSLGYKPAIIGKGYKRKSKGLVIVSDGTKITANVEQAGDEMFFLASTIKAPVIVSEKKFKSAIEAEARFDIDCIIVDDGFQHLKLHRDIDIVLIEQDALDLPYLLPKGRLREPIETISSTDFVCFFKEEQRDILVKYNKNLIKLERIYLSPYNILNKEELNIKDVIESKEGIILLSGIAKPMIFSEAMKKMDFNIVHHISFPDHHNYEVEDIITISDIAEQFQVNIIFTTEKDAVKLIQYKDLFNNNKIKIFAIPLKLNMSDLDFEKIISKLKEKYSSNV